MSFARMMNLLMVFGGVAFLVSIVTGNQAPLLFALFMVLIRISYQLERVLVWLATPDDAPAEGK